jgi:hypothetical protein
MAYSLVWLADVLRKAGLQVQEVTGWQSRGQGDVSTTLGVLCHHTAGGASGVMPSLQTLINGRPDLSGPLAHLGLARDGTFYVIAAGHANHAGAGNWKGITAGNSHLVGIEGENTGVEGDPWPDVQMDAYKRGVAAILKHCGRTSDYCVGHKEYALPVGRKTDPDFDMGPFRADVEAIMNPPAAVDPASPASGS